MTDTTDFPGIKVIVSPKTITLELDVDNGLQGVIDIFEPHMDNWRKLFGLARDLTETDPMVTGADVTADIAAAISASGATSSEPPKRGRRPKNQPDPAMAVAPPPMPIPAEVVPPVVAGPIDTTLPPFLDRAAQGVVVTPPPVMAPPPPPAAIVPPVTKLADKVIAELKNRASTAADQGTGLVAWLAGSGFVVPGVTFAEATDCLAFFDDAKIKPVADALQVA